MILTVNPRPYLPYHVLLNGKHHRIMFYKTEMLQVHKNGFQLPFNVWRDWFTEEVVTPGDWVTTVN
jgi:hypothetical protein